MCKLSSLKNSVCLSQAQKPPTLILVKRKHVGYTVQLIEPDHIIWLNCEVLDNQQFLQPILLTVPTRSVPKKIS